jgi:protein transport protein SEC31
MGGRHQRAGDFATERELNVATLRSERLAVLPPRMAVGLSSGTTCGERVHGSYVLTAEFDGVGMLKSERFCAAFAWNASGTMLAAASVAGAMDDDFSSDAFIHIYDASLSNFDQTGLKLLAKCPITDRVHRIDWSTHGGGAGIIAAGLTDGTVCLWSADALLAAGMVAEVPEEAVLYESKLHQGSVKGCQFNPMQPQFLATGGTDKELFVWNIQDPRNPLRVPSIPNSTQAAEVTDLRWNPRYPHILGVTMANGGVVIWDLKSKRAASTFSVSQNSSIACTTLAWHPEVATHLVVARDDPQPTIQLWDLRKATAPMREFVTHTGGVLAMSWSSFDTNLLVSCGRDGRTIFVNPNTGAVAGQLPQQDNWVFDVKWAPKTPAVLASASYDSQLAIFATHALVSSPEAPTWLRRPTSAVFGYGGRIARLGRQPGHITVSTAKDAAAVSTAEREFVSNLQQTRAGSAERAAWLSGAGERLRLVAVAAECSAAGSKLPLLATLQLNPQEITQRCDDIDVPVTLSTEEFETNLAACIVSGQLRDAVKLCLKADRFDDAFATAQLVGQDEVKRVYDAYVERKSSRVRAASYLGAIAQHSYASLSTDAAHGVVPWKEVLALFATAVKANEYGAACSALGNALREAGKLDEAVTCFISGGNVDAAASTIVQQKAIGTAQLVHLVTALEHTIGGQARVPEYGTILSAHATDLANEGDFATAMSYSTRAAALGVQDAAVVADRVRFLVPKERRVNAAAPFRRQAIPDPASPECQMLAGRQAIVRRGQPNGIRAGAPAHQHQHHQHHQHQSHQPHQPHQHQQHHQHHHVHHHTHHQQQHHQHHGYGQPAHGHSLPPAHQVAPQPTQQLPPPQPAPPQQQFAQPSPSPLSAPPAFGQPPRVSSPAPAGGAPSVPAPMPASSISTQASPVTRHEDPVRTVVSATVQPPAAARPVSAPPGGLLLESVDVSSLPADQQELTSRIAAATAAVSDKRKREAIDKAAVELFKRLVSGSVSPPLVELLKEYAARFGTAESKATWKAINDGHFEAVKPFLNIKFL